MTIGEEIDKAIRAVSHETGLDDIGAIRLESALRRALAGLWHVDTVLCVPAAEFTPAIADAFTSIDCTERDVLAILNGGG